MAFYTARSALTGAIPHPPAFVEGLRVTGAPATLVGAPDLPSDGSFARSLVFAELLAVLASQPASATEIIPLLWRQQDVPQLMIC